MRACEDGLVAHEPLARTYDRNPDSHGPPADDERSVTPHDGRVSNSYARHVGYCIPRSRRQIAYPYPKLTGAHAAASATQGEDAVHLLLGQFEVEHVEVFPEVLFACGFGDGADFFLLHEPAQGYLGCRLAVGLAYLP